MHAPTETLTAHTHCINCRTTMCTFIYFHTVLRTNRQYKYTIYFGIKINLLSVFFMNKEACNFAIITLTS